MHPQHLAQAQQQPSEEESKVVALQRLQHQEWLNLPHTRLVLDKLVKDRDASLARIESLSSAGQLTERALAVDLSRTTTLKTVIKIIQSYEDLFRPTSSSK